MLDRCCGKSKTSTTSSLTDFDRSSPSYDGLTEAQLDYRQQIGGRNSVYVLVAHTLGAASAWVLGIACGLEVGRDRAAEFSAGGADAPGPREDLADLEHRMAEALALLTTNDLDHRSIPTKELRGETEPHEISARGALLRTVAHAALHLGHLHLTRDLALAHER